MNHLIFTVYGISTSQHSDVCMCNQEAEESPSFCCTLAATLHHSRAMNGGIPTTSYK